MSGTHNTLYVRDMDAAAWRLQNAKSIRVLGQMI
jgi:hypothetical protein